MMNILTLSKWKGKITKDAEILRPTLEAALGNPGLCESLKRLGQQESDRDPGRHAPYFHVAKRLVRSNLPLWEEAEHPYQGSGVKRADGCTTGVGWPSE